MAQDVANPLVMHEAYFRISETIIPPPDANKTTKKTTKSYPWKNPILEISIRLAK